MFTQHSIQSQFNPQEFLSRQEKQQFVLKWLPNCKCENNKLGYHQIDIDHNFYILTPTFKVPKTLRLYFFINNEEGYNYILKLSSEFNLVIIDYEILKKNKIKKELKSEFIEEYNKIEDENKEIEKYNEKITIRVNELVEELEEIADVSKLSYANDSYDCSPTYNINPILKNKINTDHCFNFEIKTIYPFYVTYCDHNSERIKTFWYEGKILLYSECNK